LYETAQAHSYRHLQRGHAAATLARIAAAFPELYDEDIITIAESASRKLAALTEPEYSALTFASADETDG